MQRSSFCKFAIAIVLICVEWRTISACLGGAAPGACCSPAVPTCTNPCPQAYTAPQPSYGGYGNSYSTDSNPYGSESYGSSGGGYGSRGGGYGSSGGGYGSSGGGYGSEYGSRPSNLDKHGNYGGEGSYGGKSSYGESSYSRGGDEYGSLPAPSPYAAPPLPYSSSSYGQIPLAPSYGISSTYGGQQLMSSSYGQGLPYPAGIQPSYPSGSTAFIPQIPQQQGSGIPYSSALKPFTLAALDQQQQQQLLQQQQAQHFPPGPSGLAEGYVGVGEATVYPVPPYPPGGIRGPFSSRARKASAAGKKIVTVTTMTSDDLKDEKFSTKKKNTE